MTATAWGPGAAWVAPRLGELLGEPAPASFDASLHPLVDQLQRRYGAARFGASLRLRDVLVPTILGQRVTSGEARRTWWTAGAGAGRAGSRTP